MPGFKEGDLILSCSPFAYALSTEFKNQYCDFCFKESSQLKKCTRCSFTYYCDKSCQSKAWDLHQTECKYLKKADEKPNAYIRCDTLVLFKTKKYGIDKPFAEIAGRKVSFATLMSHAEDMKQNVKEKSKVNLFSFYLQKYIGSENIPSQDELFELYGKTRINSFSILDVSHTESLGVGLYLEASIFDHSCDPDAFVVFDGTTLNVRMRRNVPHRNISEIRIPYLNGTVQLTDKRQKNLLEKYYFHCECKVCISSQMDDMMTKLVNDSDEIKQKALKCENEFKEKKELLKELLTKNPSQAWKDCEKLLKDQTKVFADTNIYKVKTLRIALDACLALNASKDVIKIASSLESVLRLYLGDIHPEFGSFLLFYGQHLFSSGLKIESACKLAEALNVYKIIYGEEHPLYKSMEIFMSRILQSKV